MLYLVKSCLGLKMAQSLLKLVCKGERIGCSFVADYVDQVSSRLGKTLRDKGQFLGPHAIWNTSFIESKGHHQSDQHFESHLAEERHLLVESYLIWHQGLE